MYKSASSIEDEIDLKEVWNNIVKGKVIIASITILMTLIVGVYTWNKSYTPIYEGQVIVELGSVKSVYSPITAIDRSYDLKEILTILFPIKVEIPKRTAHLLVIRCQNKNKSEIINCLNEVVDFIFTRHQAKTKLFDTYVMTKKIKDIVISSKPINKPKDLLIIIGTFVASFMFSIFLVVFLGFISKEKDEKLTIKS